jgi:tetratricopeptide (TPR) repeat protein
MIDPHPPEQPARKSRPSPNDRSAAFASPAAELGRREPWFLGTAQAPASTAAQRRRLQLAAPATDLEGGQRQRYRAVFQHIYETLPGSVVALEHARAQAPALLGELLSLSPAQRLLRVRNSPRFQSWALVGLLLERTRSEEDGDEAMAWTELAFEVLNQLPAQAMRPTLGHDLRCRAHACAARALTLRGELDDASLALAQARAELELGTGDPLEQAHVAGHTATWLRAKGRLREAEESLLTARRLFDHAAQPELCATCSLELADLCAGQGRQRDAFHHLEQVLLHADPDVTPEVFVGVERIFWRCLSDVTKRPALPPSLAELRSWLTRSTDGGSA